jgi:WD40 repeat protein
MEDKNQSIKNEVQKETSVASSCKQAKQQKGASAGDNLLPLETTVYNNKNPTTIDLMTTRTHDEEEDPHASSDISALPTTANETSMLPYIPMTIILKDILPLVLDRVSFNRLRSMDKEIHDASRNMTPPWPCKSLRAGSNPRLFEFSPDNGILACAYADWNIQICNRKNGPCDQLMGHTDQINSLSFSPDGELLASAGEDMVIRLWTLADHSCIILEGHTNGINCLSFSPNGELLASGGDDNVIRLWTLADNNCIILEGHAFSVRSVVFSPDGETLTSESYDGSVRLWDVVDGSCTRVLRVIDAEFRFLNLLDEDDRTREEMSTPYVCAFSADGQYAATGSGGTDLKVRLWNVANRKLLAVSKGHTDCIRSVCFSPNCKILASASDDRSIRLWEVNDAGDGGCLLHLSEHHTGEVRSMEFSPCGRMLVSGCVDGNVRLWNPFEEAPSKRDKKVDWKKFYSLWSS